MKGDAAWVELLDVTRKVVLITRGAAGIGRATALALARQGADVVIGDVDEPAQETVRVIEDTGGAGLFVRTDVTSADDVKRLVRTAVDTFWAARGLQQRRNSAPDRTAAGGEEDFDRTVAVDLKGAFLALKYEIEHMAAAGGGSIINTASVAGVITDPGMEWAREPLTDVSRTVPNRPDRRVRAGRGSGR